MQTIKPPRLRSGDLLGVVAPSNEVVSIRAEVELGMRRLEEYGFQVREGAHLWARRANQAGTRYEQPEEAATCDGNRPQKVTC